MPGDAPCGDDPCDGVYGRAEKRVGDRVSF